jgi:hypothetical protein
VDPAPAACATVPDSGSGSSRALEPDFHSADEAASVLRDHAPSESFERLRQQMRDQSMRLMLPSRSISDGFVYVPRVEGGRYLDLLLMRDV